MEMAKLEQPPSGNGGDGYVAVLDVDLDLGATIPAKERELARQHLTAPYVDAEPGPWEEAQEIRAGLGLLVVRGLLTRNLEVAGASSRELLGPGDVIRPWDDEPELPIPTEADWTVLEPARLAILDERFFKLVGRWPELGSELVHRILRRSRWLAVRLAIATLRGVTDRVMLLFWHLSGAWGRVTPEGTLLPHPLTHELIADLIGARRPSVTTAISELRESGRLERLEDGWLLVGPAPSQVREGMKRAE